MGKVNHRKHSRFHRTKVSFNLYLYDAIISHIPCVSWETLKISDKNIWEKIRHLPEFWSQIFTYGGGGLKEGKKLCTNKRSTPPLCQDCPFTERCAAGNKMRKATRCVLTAGLALQRQGKELTSTFAYQFTHIMHLVPAAPLYVWRTLARMCPNVFRISSTQRQIHSCQCKMSRSDFSNSQISNDKQNQLKKGCRFKTQK